MPGTHAAINGADAESLQRKGIVRRYPRATNTLGKAVGTNMFATHTSSPGPQCRLQLLVMHSNSKELRPIRHEL